MLGSIAPSEDLLGLNDSYVDNSNTFGGAVSEVDIPSLLDDFDAGNISIEELENAQHEGYSDLNYDLSLDL